MDKSTVSKLNEKIKKNVKLTKENKKKDNKFICYKCNLEFSDDSSLSKHKFLKHPSNEYEHHWSKITDWSNYSLAYRDDPYY